MIFYSQAQIDQWLLDDIQGGDLTTRALGIGDRQGRMVFQHRQGGCISGLEVARQMLQRLGLVVELALEDGWVVRPGDTLLIVSGRVDALHQGWKAVQNVLEWSCGVTRYLFDMLRILRQHVPDGQIACTRKTIPGTKLLATQAVLAGGGIIHRAGCAETILLFANHRHFWANPDDWRGMVAALRREAPEKTIIVEADNIRQAEAALAAGPDMVQLDKCPIDDVPAFLARAARLAPRCRFSLAGGITLDTIDAWARTGVPLLVTSAPYYAPPADISVRLDPQ
ncbi:ModD protein [Affinibrenneria salicis]|uniref:Putative pyrophosphorylase ModD n=1 Tax=Affinibrenneria salicis TaxID=2590031 RepID=A0A5J5G605_9GAMM|nr:ModD protein [Affinibrenneria salicis]KAA9002551.1 ModD protein [Affinibrenneria salicis]KAA9003161.1 ModD protein [Affinibrenneria salicis]